MTLERRKRILFVVAALLAGAVALSVFRPLSYTPMKTDLNGKTFDDLYREKLSLSRAKGARPGNEERLIRFANRTPIAFLYIHGYGASRAEGEEVLDRLANKLKANTYYMRLPGHGTSPEDQATATYTDYLNAAEEAYAMTGLLGDRVIVVGTSMGALLATYLGSRHPEIDALILASPFFDFNAKQAHLANEFGGMTFLEIMNGGPYRKMAHLPNDPNDTRIAGYEDFWYAKQYLKSLRSLEDLREYTARKGTYERVTMPVLMLYYYKDEERHDQSASVSAMLEGFHQLGTFDRPNPLNRAVAIERGNHVLLSHWVEADHERCFEEMLQFAKNVAGADARKKK